MELLKNWTVTIEISLDVNGKKNLAVFPKKFCEPKFDGLWSTYSSSQYFWETQP